jgi:ABC-type transporter Mla subunit MlaD
MWTHSRAARLCIALALALTLCAPLAGCRDDPMGRTVARFDALVQVMESNKEDPDALLTALDAFITQNTQGFAQDRAALLALDAESILQLSGKHEDNLQAKLMDLMDVTLEIQDRLRYQPDKLQRFLLLLERLR